MSNAPIPALPHTIDLIGKNADTLYIERLENAVFDENRNAFVGGEFCHLPISKDGFPVWIRINGKKLIVQQLYGCVTDKKKSGYIGGEMRTLLELDLG